MIQDTDAATLQGFVDEAVSDAVELVATDEHSGYSGLRRKGMPHESVSHVRKEYVRGNVHTQTIDSFWSLLKRGIMGTYHKVSADYLPLYMNEFAFKRNHRASADIFGDVVRAS